MGRIHLRISTYSPRQKMTPVTTYKGLDGTWGQPGALEKRENSHVANRTPTAGATALSL
jgi:hypothetical protein